MAIDFEKSQAALAAIATSLAEDAASIGKAALSTSLDELSTEISGATLTEFEFFNNSEAAEKASQAGNTWSNILRAAANAISANGVIDLGTLTANTGTIVTHLGTINTHLDTIESHLDRIQSIVDDVGEESIDQYDGSLYNPGPHVRMIGTAWKPEVGHVTDSKVGRAMMMNTVKVTGILDALREEIANPTPLTEPEGE